MKTLYKASAYFIIFFCWSTTSTAQDFQSSPRPSVIGNQTKPSQETFGIPGIHDKQNSDLSTLHLPPKHLDLGDISDEELNIHGLDNRDTPVNVNMMECAEGGQASSMVAVRQFRTTTLIRPKYIAMQGVLSLSDQEAEAFFPIYARYEAELSQLESFAPDDESTSEKHQMLRDAYFEQFNSKSGSYLAFRFLAWENYYSQACKAGR